MSGGVIATADAPYERSTVIVTNRRCEACGWGWQEYPDGPHQCPDCVPVQPKTFAARVRDPHDFLGREWVWDQGAGPCGSWVPLKEFVLVHADDWDTFRTALRTLPPHVLNLGARALPQLVEKLAEAYERIAQLESRRAGAPLFPPGIAPSMPTEVLP